MDMRRDRVDVALRHGLGVYPGLHMTRLMAPVLVPVASPALLTANSNLSEPQDCLDFPLLYVRLRSSRKTIQPWCIRYIALAGFTTTAPQCRITSIAAFVPRQRLQGLNQKSANRLQHNIRRFSMRNMPTSLQDQALAGYL